MNETKTTVTPKYVIGQKVWAGTTTDGEWKTDCPDCLGQHSWTWASPAGATGTVECPRCHGRGALTQRCAKPLVRQLTIGSVRTDTAGGHYGRYVEYMCVETGVGSGNVYGEDDLFTSEADAQPCAEAHAASQNERMDKANPRLVELRSLGDYQIRDAKTKEAESRERETWSRLNRLLERICELSEHNSVSGRYVEKDQFRSSSLKEDQVAPLQEALMSYSEENADFLDEWRAADKECDC